MAATDTFVHVRVAVVALGATVAAARSPESKVPFRFQSIQPASWAVCPVRFLTETDTEYVGSVWGIVAAVTGGKLATPLSVSPLACAEDTPAGSEVTEDPRVSSAVPEVLY